MFKIFENAVGEERFKMNNLMNNLMNDIIDNHPQISTLLQATNSRFQEARTFDLINKSLIRNVFLIELVNERVTSTKFEVRWSHRLQNDPRFSNFQACLEIYLKLLNDILKFNEKYIDLLADFTNNSIVSYELPLDYISRNPNTPNSKIHHLNNISWIEENLVEEILLLRKLLLDESYNEENTLFADAMKSKIKVKTYLTDRALTGEHKTNREKRWETHPNSVQFALRRECWKIERTLLLQICRFENAPEDLVTNLIQSNLLDEDFAEFTCPIIGDKIDFLDFKAAILNVNHGRSKYQVGHMNPLKSITDGTFGHTAQNISWITENGNRIQGSLSLDEVETLLRRIYTNRNYSNC
ncbi:hypothetical protein CJ194_23710 [Priestia megaterium]|uniref:hypothetical protein n=1 Tax=Priestia megaterium TaxID=1404 RepID=UPI000C804E49|nr:hypothetical protein [Priestia megaterium]PMD07611.1 hypothetical protein CJ194_23710 [Priestia megaterium]